MSPERSTAAESGLIARLAVLELPLPAFIIPVVICPTRTVPHSGDNDEVPHCAASTRILQPFVAVYGWLAGSVLADGVHVYNAYNITSIPVSRQVST